MQINGWNVLLIRENKIWDGDGNEIERRCAKNVE